MRLRCRRLQLARALRDWSYRLMVVGLRWTTPLLLVMADLPVFYLALLLRRRGGVGGHLLCHLPPPLPPFAYLIAL